MTVDYILKNILQAGSGISREISEWAGPAYDLYREGDTIVVQIDLPGFELKNLKPSIHKSEYGSAIHIEATRKTIDEKNQEVFEAHRPQKVCTDILIPVFAKDDAEVIKKATYVNGVLSLTLIQVSSGNPIDIKE